MTQLVKPREEETVEDGSKDAAPQQEPDVWKAQAEFWKRKYFEQMMHYTQVIAQLSRGTL